jgi:hypothetical protein
MQVACAAQSLKVFICAQFPFVWTATLVKEKRWYEKEFRSVIIYNLIFFYRFFERSWTASVV